ESVHVVFDGSNPSTSLIEHDTGEDGRIISQTSKPSATQDSIIYEEESNIEIPKASPSKKPN
ncbi:hypothetical protein HAX54_038451, partial [Datura stramonium]|nr:hypothetical protein [Datura stramonium]